MISIVEKIKDFIERKKEEREDLNSFLYEEKRNDYRQYRNFNIKLNIDVYRKLYFYTCAASGEISGLGKIKIMDNSIIVTDVSLFKQTCSGASTDLDKENLHKFVVDLIKQKQNANEWRLWWHSHDNFGAGWSSKDDTNIEEHSKRKMLVSICTDKTGYMVGRVDRNYKTADLPIVLSIGGMNGKLKQKCIAEVKEKVQEEHQWWERWSKKDITRDKSFNIHNISEINDKEIKISIDGETIKEEGNGLHTSTGFSDYE